MVWIQMICVGVGLRAVTYPVQGALMELGSGQHIWAKSDQQIPR